MSPNLTRKQARIAKEAERFLDWVDETPGFDEVEATQTEETAESLRRDRMSDEAERLDSKR